MDKIVKSDAEWREQLSDLAYQVTRNGRRFLRPSTATWSARAWIAAFS